MPHTSGHTDPAFGAVREVFEELFADGREIDAGLDIGDVGASLGEPGALRYRSLANSPGRRDPAVLNGPLWRETEVPAVYLHATATGVARFYQRLLDDDGSFGMGGFGGSCGYALPAGELALGFVTRHLAGFDRFEALEAAVTAAIRRAPAAP